MTEWQVFKNFNGQRHIFGPDFYLGYGTWLEYSKYPTRGYVYPRQPTVEELQKQEPYLNFEGIYYAKYVNPNIITSDEFDGLYDEFGDQPNTEILHSLIRYKTLHYLLEQYYKGRYVLDPYDGEPIKRYEDVQVDVDGLDGTVKIFIKRQSRIDV